MPRPATLDIDIDIGIGIALDASAGQYGSLSADLQTQGFRQSETFPSRFEKKADSFTLYLDFLVEHPPATRGTVAVDDVSANILPGIDRALATARSQVVEGLDLFGVHQRFSIPICEVGPYLALKLRAFAHRQAPKDAFDILYTTLQYDGGTDAAIEGFRAESSAGNTAVPDALGCLQNYFAHEDSATPVRAAHFVHGEVQPGEDRELELLRQQIRQDVVTLGKMLPNAK